jgi:hypothetical protein
MARNRQTGLRPKSENAQIKAPAAETPHDNHLALLDLLPIAARVLPGAPDKIKTALLDAFDINAVYRKDVHPVTIYATLTGTCLRMHP